MAELPVSECPTCGKPLKRRRSRAGFLHECSDRECREAADIAARWMASELKPPSS